jgi:aspartate aminotransferase-like enzyme
MRKPLLFLPGPMQAPDFVLSAGSRPMFSHRSPEMLELIAKLETGCRPLFGTDQDVLFLAASGSGSMESGIVNLTSPGEEILVVVGGTFARRWVQIAEGYGLTVRTLETDWRKAISLAEVQNAMIQWPDVKTVFVTWSESSTGVLSELKEIGKLVRSQNKILVADAVSGLAVSPMAMDDWNIDAVIVGSQKGLMLPPGLAVVAVGARAWEKNQNSRTPRFYWDWKKYKNAVPFTPPITLLFQLEASLEYIKSEGLESIFDRRAKVAAIVRDLVEKSGMEVYALNPGNGITGVIPPEEFDIGAFVRRLDVNFGIQIAGGLGPLKGKMFRIGHVGHLTDEEVDYFIKGFRTCLT